MYLEELFDSLNGKKIVLPRTIDTYGGGETFKADFVEIAETKGYKVDENASLTTMREADHIMLVNGSTDINNRPLLSAKSIQKLKTKTLKYSICLLELDKSKLINTA